MNWLLLLHQLPPSPPYFRAKVLRRLNQLGALPIKNSAYLLPATEEATEDMQWIGREIEEGGGEAWLFRTEAIAGLTEDAIRESFRGLRAPEYSEIAESGRVLLQQLREGAGDTNLKAECRKLKRRFDEVRRIDFFEAAGRTETETIMDTMDRLLNSAATPQTKSLLAAEVKGRTWVTRRGIKVDRMASAWLIRRFIDPAAKFSFVDPAIYKQAAHEIRFDMFEGEFTHRGDKCTFEVLLEWSGNAGAGLRALAEVVHDIDLKDRKFQRSEVAGIVPVIDGITLRHNDDARRLEDATALFESLHAHFSKEPE